jgi:proliferating cell nuclear antigen|tara:strand:+ start:280 stop:1014 length:735 start_codon:yes stop_codon:yes gene_type:complete
MFQHIKLFSDYINITFNKDKMFLQTMDTSRVSIFEIILPNIWFDTYEILVDSDITIGVQSDLLFKVLHTRDKNQSVQFQYKEEESDKLQIHFINDNKNIFDKHFELPLIDIEVEILSIPEFDTNVDITLLSHNFASIITQLQLFGDTITFKCNEEKIELLSVNPAAGKMTADINIDDLTSYSITENESFNNSFSLGKLHNICLYNKMSQELEISITNNFPMRITYGLGMDNAKMLFYLAPKIDD